MKRTTRHDAAGNLRLLPTRTIAALQGHEGKRPSPSGLLGMRKRPGWHGTADVGEQLMYRSGRLVRQALACLAPIVPGGLSFFVSEDSSRHALSSPKRQGVA